MIKDTFVFIKNNLFAIVTAFIAIIALFQTHKQIKNSNKQFLFDKRLDKYLLAKGLLELYKANEKLLDYNNYPDDEAIIVDFQFINLTNNNYLKDLFLRVTLTGHSQSFKEVFFERSKQKSRRAFRSDLK